MRKTRLVVQTRKCLHTFGFLLLYMSCPVIGDWGLVQPESAMIQRAISIDREGSRTLIKDPPKLMNEQCTADSYGDGLALSRDVDQTRLSHRQTYMERKMTPLDSRNLHQRRDVRFERQGKAMHRRESTAGTRDERRTESREEARRMQRNTDRAIQSRREEFISRNSRERTIERRARDISRMDNAANERRVLTSNRRSHFEFETDRVARRHDRRSTESRMTERRAVGMRRVNAAEGNERRESRGSIQRNSHREADQRRMMNQNQVRNTRQLTERQSMEKQRASPTRRLLKARADSSYESRGFRVINNDQPAENPRQTSPERRIAEKSRNTIRNFRNDRVNSAERRIMTTTQRRGAASEYREERQARFSESLRRYAPEGQRENRAHTRDTIRQKVENPVVAKDEQRRVQHREDGRRAQDGVRRSLYRRENQETRNDHAVRDARQVRMQDEARRSIDRRESRGMQNDQILSRSVRRDARVENERNVRVREDAVISAQRRDSRDIRNIHDRSDRRTELQRGARSDRRIETNIQEKSRLFMNDRRMELERNARVQSVERRDNRQTENEVESSRLVRNNRRVENERRASESRRAMSEGRNSQNDREMARSFRTESRVRLERSVRMQDGTREAPERRESLDRQRDARSGSDTQRSSRRNTELRKVDAIKVRSTNENTRRNIDVRDSSRRVQEMERRQTADIRRQFAESRYIARNAGMKAYERHLDGNQTQAKILERRVEGITAGRAPQRMDVLTMKPYSEEMVMKALSFKDDKWEKFKDLAANCFIGAMALYMTTRTAKAVH